MSATVQSLSQTAARGRTGGVERTRYELFVAFLIAASPLIEWLTPDEVVTSIMELINAGFDDNDPAKAELYQKLLRRLTDHIEDEADLMVRISEPVDRETLEFMDSVMSGGREAA